MQLALVHRTRGAEGGKVMFKGKYTFVKIQGDILWAERLKFCVSFVGFNLALVWLAGAGIWGCTFRGVSVPPKAPGL